VATIKDVARQAGVSVGTVSNVLSGTVAVRGELRDRVYATIRKLDYHPNYVARSLKAKATKTLGLIISDITNPFFTQVVRGAEDAAFRHGYLLITFNTDDQHEREKQILSLLRSRRVDGVMLVVAPNPTNDATHIRNAINCGIPIVCLDRAAPGIAVDSVWSDNVKGAQVCVRHLIKQGFRRIGVIAGSLTLRTALDRLEGYRSALGEASIPVNPDLIAEGNFRQDSGYRLAKRFLLRFQRPDALFICNGMMTIGAIQALEETGLRCPADIAIASFDDLPMTEVFRPHLTAVAQPAYQIGYQGCELLIKRVLHQLKSQRPVKILLEAELNIRESTAFRAPLPAFETTVAE
jgi:LacI family transcriptional regulator